MKTFLFLLMALVLNQEYDEGDLDDILDGFLDYDDYVDDVINEDADEIFDAEDYKEDYKELKNSLKEIKDELKSDLKEFQADQKEDLIDEKEDLKDDFNTKEEYKFNKKIIKIKNKRYKKLVGLNKSMISKTSSYKKKQFKLINKNL